MSVTLASTCTAVSTVRSSSLPQAPRLGANTSPEEPQQHHCVTQRCACKQQQAGMQLRLSLRGLHKEHKPRRCLLSTLGWNDLVSCSCLCAVFELDRDFCSPCQLSEEFSTNCSFQVVLEEPVSFKKAALSATRKRIPSSIKVRHKSILFFFKHTLSPALFTKYISFIKELSLLQGMTITEVLTTLLCSWKKNTKSSQSSFYLQLQMVIKLLDCIT